MDVAVLRGLINVLLSIGGDNGSGIVLELVGEMTLSASRSNIPVHVDVDYIGPVHQILFIIIDK